MSEEPHRMFVINGTYSKEFREKMGLKEFHPPLFDLPVKGVEPMMGEPVALAYALKVHANLLVNPKEKVRC